MTKEMVDVKGFFMSRHFYDGIKALSPEQVKDLILALYADMGCGDAPELDPISQMVLTMMLPQIHEIQNNALKRKITNQENGKLGGRPRKNIEKEESEENQQDGETEKTEKTNGFLENQNKPIASEKPINKYIHTDNNFKNISCSLSEKVSDGEGTDVVQSSLIPDADDVKVKKPEVPNCPQDKIIELYHECLPELPQIRSWIGANGTNLRTRWRERWAAGKYKTTEEGLVYWHNVFVWIHDNCPHLMGQNDRGWKMNLAWLVKAANFSKFLNRTYDRQVREVA